MLVQVDEQQRLVGVLSLADVAKSAHVNEGSSELRRAIVSALGVICQRAALVTTGEGPERPSLAPA